MTKKEIELYHALEDAKARFTTLKALLNFKEVGVEEINKVVEDGVQVTDKMLKKHKEYKK